MVQRWLTGSWCMLPTCQGFARNVGNVPHEPVTRKAPVLNQAKKIPPAGLEPATSGCRLVALSRLPGLYLHRGPGQSLGGDRIVSTPFVPRHVLAGVAVARTL